MGTKDNNKLNYEDVKKVNGGFNNKLNNHTNIDLNLPYRPSGFKTVYKVFCTTCQMYLNSGLSEDEAKKLKEHHEAWWNYKHKVELNPYEIPEVQ